MKIVLAGGEAWWDRFRDHGIRNILFSYHYLRSQNDFHEMTEWMQEARATGWTDPATGIVRPYFFMLDSGAYTFKVQGDPNNRIDDYAKEYIEFLAEHPAASLFDVVAELDVEIDVYDEDQDQVIIDGKERALTWREELAEVAGRKLMPVWGGTSLEDLHSIAKDQRFDWMGVASGLSADIYMQRKAITVGHANGKRVHGFGMTRLQTDMKYLTNYDSVDSTTWLRADKYGGTFIVRKGSLVILDHKSKHLRKNYKRYFAGLGLDPNKILGTHMDHIPRCPGPDSQTKGCEACRDQLLELRSSSLIAWRNLIAHYERFEDKHLRERPTPQLLMDDDEVEDNKPKPERPTHDDATGGAGEEGLRRSNLPAEDSTEAPTKGEKGGMNRSHTMGHLSPAKTRTKGGKGKTLYPEFGGFRCPHYRRRPAAVMDSLNCRACVNLATCEALETGNTPPPTPTLPGDSAVPATIEQSNGRKLDNIIPETYRLPVVTQGGLNLGALRQGMPRIECNTCAISEDCPKYSVGAVCAFNEIFDQFDTRNSDDLYAIQQMLVEMDVDRTMRFLLLERLTTGGVVDPKVTSQMDSLQRRISLLHEMQVSRSPNPRTGAPALHLHHHAPLPPGDATPGMLSKLFGGGGETEPEAVNVETVDKKE